MLVICGCLLTLRRQPHAPTNSGGLRWLLLLFTVVGELVVVWASLVHLEHAQVSVWCLVLDNVVHLLWTQLLHWQHRIEPLSFLFDVMCVEQTGHMYYICLGPGLLSMSPANNRSHLRRRSSNSLTEKNIWAKIWKCPGWPKPIPRNATSDLAELPKSLPRISSSFPGSPAVGNRRRFSDRGRRVFVVLTALRRPPAPIARCHHTEASTPAALFGLVLPHSSSFSHWSPSGFDRGILVFFQVRVNFFRWLYHFPDRLLNHRHYVQRFWEGQLN